MSLSKRQEQYLNKIAELVEKVKLEAAKAKNGSNGKVSATRRRRSAAEAEKMRGAILAARAKGVSAAKLADKYGVSTAYIYMIKG
jgi:nicotinic acid phosphoribosyltransferase